MFKDYNVQADAVEKIEKNFHTLNRHFSMLTAETGAGKTYVAARLAKNFTDKQKTVLVIAPKTIAKKWERVLTEGGVNMGLVSIYALPETGMTGFEQFKDQFFDLILWDEMHTAYDRAHMLDMLDTNPKKTYLLGITATSINKSVDEVFDVLNYLDFKKLFQHDLFNTTQEDKMRVPFLNLVFKYGFTIGFTKEDVLKEEGY